MLLITADPSGVVFLSGILVANPTAVCVFTHDQQALHQPPWGRRSAWSDGLFSKAGWDKAGRADQGLNSTLR